MVVGDGCAFERSGKGERLWASGMFRLSMDLIWDWAVHSQDGRLFWLERWGVLRRITTVDVVRMNVLALVNTRKKPRVGKSNQNRERKEGR